MGEMETKVYVPSYLNLETMVFLATHLNLEMYVVWKVTHASIFEFKREGVYVHQYLSLEKKRECMCPQVVFWDREYEKAQDVRISSC